MNNELKKKANEKQMVLACDKDRQIKRGTLNLISMTQTSWHCLYCLYCLFECDGNLALQDWKTNKQETDK